MVYGEAAGICNASAGVAAECEDARGGVFETGESTTWQQTGQWALGLDQDLGQSGVGQYGIFFPFCSNPSLFGFLFGVYST